MNRKPRRKRKVLPFFLVTVILLSICYIGCSEENGKDTATGQATLSGENVEPITFPYVVEDGKLEVTSLFQYTGINPDCGNEDGTDIAAIELKNLSEDYLVEADVVMTLADGTERHFFATDIPAGRAVLTFSIDNETLSMSDVCTEVCVETVFEDIQSAENVLVSVDGTTIALENTSVQDMKKVDVYCHDAYEDKLFGGVTYKYEVEKIPAGDKAEVVAADCILGMPDVVRVEVND